MVNEGAITGNLSEVTSKKAQLVSLQGRGAGFVLSSVTGTIGAALAANSSIFAMRFDTGAGNKRAFIEKVRLTFTCIVAFTVPITAGRRLSLFRGSGANASGGTALATVGKKHSASVDSEVEAANGGDARISTTGALTVTGITFETNELAVFSLVHTGTAGAFSEEIFEFNASENTPIVLEPGQLLAIRNPVVMDAAGTWQASVRVDWYEEDSVTL